MTWVEIIRRVKRRLQQSGSNPIDNETYKIYGTDRQIGMSEEAPLMFERRRSFDTVAGTAEYAVDVSAIGADTLQIYRMIYDDEIELHPIKQSNIPYPLQSGTPSNYYIRDGFVGGNAGGYLHGKVIGFTPTPDAVATVEFFCFRRPPRWALAILHDGSADATGATYNIESSVLTLIITGGANAGTNTIDFTVVPNDTITGVVTAVNALAKGFGARASADFRGLVEASGLLEETESEPGVYESPSILNKTAYLYENPEVPLHAERCLMEGMMADASADQGWDNRSQLHEARYERMLRERKVYTKQQARGTGIGVTTDVYSDGIDPELRLPGGWIVR